MLNALEEEDETPREEVAPMHCDDEAWPQFNSDGGMAWLTPPNVMAT